MNKSKLTLQSTCGMLLMIMLGGSSAALAQNYENLTGLKAADFAPAELLKGPYHTVDEMITVAGAQPNFMIRSPYGVWEARGREMLGIRVSELPAFEQLAKVSKSDEFMKAAGNAVAAPVKAVGELIESPVQTTGNILSGIGLVFSRVGRVAEEGVNKVGDTLSNNAPEKKEILKPVPPPLGTMAPRSVIGDPLGFNQQRREWAQRLKVDPYTFNGKLSDQLGQISSVTFASSFPVNVVLSSVIAPVYYAQEMNEQAKQEAYAIPAIDVGIKNEKRLKDMGIEGLPVRTLFRNNYFTPTLQTALVLALETLANVPGRDQVIVFAARVTSETETRYVNNSVMMLVQQHRKTPLTRIRAADNVLVGETADGKLFVAAPYDYIPWIEPVDAFARRTDLKGTERLLLISGRATPRATQELSAKGWRVIDNLAAAK